jgi:hypothetical protein
MIITTAPREVSIFIVVSIWLPGSGAGFALPPRMSRRLQIAAITEPDKSDGRSVVVIDGVDTCPPPTARNAGVDAGDNAKCGGGAMPNGGEAGRPS